MTLLELCKRSGFEGIKKITKAEQAPSQHRDKAQHLLDIFDACYYDEAADILGSKHSLSLRMAEYYLSLVESGEFLSLGEKERSAILFEDSVFRETLADYIEVILSFLRDSNEDKEEETEYSENTIEDVHQPHLPLLKNSLTKSMKKPLNIGRAKKKSCPSFGRIWCPIPPKKKSATPLSVLSNTTY